MPEAAASTIAAHLKSPPRAARRGSVPRAWAFVRPGLLIVAVICVAVVAIVAVNELHASTSSALRADATLGQLDSGLHALQDVPWETAAVGGTAQPVVVLAQLKVAERRLSLLLAKVMHEMPSPSLQRIEPLMMRNFKENRRLATLLAQRKINLTPGVRLQAASTNDQIGEALGAARADYGSRANASLTQGTIGSSAVIVALVLVFLFAYRLSIRGREDRFHRDEAERASRAKSEFLSRVSHELRTPLNAILGFAQLVSRSDLNERQRANVGRIARAGRHLLELINEVLDISRIEAGEMRLSLEPVRVTAMVGDVLDLVGPLADARSVTVTADSSSVETWIHADVQRIKQVLLNLVSNAVNYNRAGGHVTLSAAPGSAGRIRLAVADDGHGIPTEMMGRVFSPFERLGAEATTVEGTGLGLALSKGFVEAMGGTLTVTSAVGIGSTFTVDLAAAQPRTVARPERRAPSRGSSPAKPGRKVLYIEDNISNLELVEELFAERPDITLLTAVQGTLGISLAREHHPDVVLLDLNLPDISGEVVLEQLRGDSATANTPVIVLTADATKDQRARVQSRGATAYLTKPIDVDELLRVVDDALLTGRIEAA